VNFIGANLVVRAILRESEEADTPVVRFSANVAYRPRGSARIILNDIPSALREIAQSDIAFDIAFTNTSMRIASISREKWPASMIGGT